jgi:putative salt-induced outer membrane protein
MKTTASALGLGCVLTLLAGKATAQASLVDDKKTTTGTTDVHQEGFQKAQAPVADGKVNETDAKVSAGAFLSTGNAKALAITGAGTLRLRRGFDQFTLDLAANYGEASVTPGTPQETTVENYQARARYDRFLSQKWALFVQESFRRDRFQGLDLRLNFDPGLAYYLLIEEKQHLTVEAGYDLQYDVRTLQALADAEAAGTPAGATEVRHALRLFAGYDNSLNEHVRFDTGLEYLQAFAAAENFRLNWVSSLTANLTEAFAVAAGFTLRYDNNPLPGIEQLDTITTLSLVYSLK